MPTKSFSVFLSLKYLTTIALNNNVTIENVKIRTITITDDLLYRGRYVQHVLNQNWLFIQKYKGLGT